MQRTLWRALLLAVSLLTIGVLPVLAQSESPPPVAPETPVAGTSATDGGWLLSSEDDNVIVAIQRDVAVADGESTDGVVIVEGQALIEGAVESLFGAEADVIIRGTGASVDRLFTVGGTLTIDAGATIGDAYYTDTDVSGVNEAAITITGELSDARQEFIGALGAIAAVLIVLLFFVVIGAFIAMLALTLLVIAFGTAQVRRAAATISNDVLKTIVVGILGLIVPGILFWILFVTIVGIPLAIALWLLWGLVVFLGWIVVGTWIGERVLPRARTANRPYGAAFLGMLILLLLSWTGIVPLLATIFGTGAVTLAGWRVLRSGGVPPVPPGYGQPYGQPMMAPPPGYAPPSYAPPPYAPPPPGPGQWPPQGGQPPGAWPQG